MKGLNTAELDKRLLKLSTALLVQKEVRKCTSLKQIYTYFCTETVALHGQDQSLLFGINNRSVSFLGAGNVQPADPDAPLIRSIRKIVRQYLHNDGAATSAATVHVFIPGLEVSGQHEMNGLASNWLWIPLLDSDTRLIGVLLLLRNSPWTDREMLLAETMGEAYGYSLSTLQNRPSLRLRIKPIGTVAFILILCLLYLVKIPLLTFGDAQIVASHPVPVTSPLQGVVKKVHVPAFRMVHAGDLLVSFDKTELQATRDVAEKNLQVTQAELERIKLQSYQDPKMKSQLVIWQKKTELHNRQLTFAEKT